ncbi:hypothetical protein BU25DRAFT_484032 [Macroventuria anomochaeta]|uniref:Uncharacterized protein n=1 Tax=Macroventuria anomochaeta TaxID=301207 RepID=A0ACB6RJF2_9PLEO|nr:uncharacterized protein BU25DRAFT_484032 [Macroventuria anomochaeta]KAF2621099.1 hypothetical protein BU25DRAFT_484032 [Macroventuria anomochaeta]
MAFAKDDASSSVNSRTAFVPSTTSTTTISPTGLRPSAAAGNNDGSSSSVTVLIVTHEHSTSESFRASASAVSTDQTMTPVIELVTDEGRTVPVLTGTRTSAAWFPGPTVLTNLYGSSQLPAKSILVHSNTSAVAHPQSSTIDVDSGKLVSPTSLYSTVPLLWLQDTDGLTPLSNSTAIFQTPTTEPSNSTTVVESSSGERTVSNAGIVAALIGFWVLLLSLVRS